MTEHKNPGAGGVSAVTHFRVRRSLSSTGSGRQVAGVDGSISFQLGA